MSKNVRPRPAAANFRLTLSMSRFCLFVYLLIPPMVSLRRKTDSISTNSCTKTKKRQPLLQSCRHFYHSITGVRQKQLRLQQTFGFDDPTLRFERPCSSSGAAPRKSRFIRDQARSKGCSRSKNVDPSRKFEKKSCKSKTFVIKLVYSSRKKSIHREKVSISSIFIENRTAKATVTTRTVDKSRNIRGFLSSKKNRVEQRNSTQTRRNPPPSR